MTDFLYEIDKTLFYWINHGWSNPVFDVVMPFITNRVTWFPVWIALVAWLILKGGRKGRIVAALIIPVIFLTDQVSSELIKPFIDRVRPSNALPDVYLLVKRTMSDSFPSSHAANFFAGATLLTWFYRKTAWICFSLATLVALSRPYVGVHYPSDILGGAVLGSLLTLAVIWLYLQLAKKSGLPWLQTDLEGVSK
ncbi:MAG: phosphatase PAP2 family protein [Bacteroidetes bacterium]|nr:phosphatase PAP2 family protein [Bacteroidota bacterium]